MDHIVGGKFKIGRIIGSGSFGELYEGVNIESEEKVAIKLEPVKTEDPLLHHESEMYKLLHGGTGIPNLKWFGVEGEHNIMVIDLLGQSLADLLKSCGGKFSLKTVLMLAVQLIDTLEYIHSRGVVHRDIKPDNLLMGSGSYANQVYLVDFGLAGLYKDLSTDEHIPYWESKSFMGTYRYASMFTHYGIEQSRRDDLDSLGYVLLYFLRGSLPWQGLSAGKDEKELNELLFNKKFETSFEELCKSYPPVFEFYFSYCRRLSFKEKPNYFFLRRLFQAAFDHQGYQFDYIYDWPTPQKDGKKARRNRNRNRNRNKNKKKGDGSGGNEETNGEK